MRNSNTTLRELSALYRPILKKCFLFNAAVMICVGLSSNVSATPITERVVIEAGQSQEFSAVEASGLSSDETGAVMNTSGGLNLTNATFTNNSTNADGGAIRINIKDGQEVNISNSTFDGNKAVGYSAADSGAISIGNGTVAITNTHFLNNEAKFAGAIYAYTGNTHYVQVSIKDSLFEGNKASAIGALGNFASARNADTLGVTGGMSIENTIFRNNQATASDDDGAGALFLGSESQTSIKNSEFTGNTSASRGGAISMRTNNLGNHSTANVDIIDTQFTSNTAATYGGAIFNTFYNSKTTAGAVTVSGSSFSKNQAQNGGAIFNDGSGDKGGNTASMALLNNTFSDNKASNMGGAIANTGKMTVENTTFTKNSSGTAGGAIYTFGELSIKDSLFEGNIAGVAGAITDVYDANALTTITGTEFKNNHVVWDGGAMAAYAKVDISDSIFSGNTAAVTVDGVVGDASSSDGGGAIIVGGTSDVSLKNVQFIGNESAVRGGAISARHGANKVLSMDGVEFTQNKSGNFGGALASIYSGVVEAKNTQFTANEAKEAGGAIYIGKDTNYGSIGGVTSTNNGTLNLTGTNTFSGNIAGSMGGAIYADQGGILNFSGTNTFTGNTAAGIANDIHNTGRLNILDGTTTIDGGITGTGYLTVSNGAVLDIGTAKVEQDKATFESGSTLKANLLNTSSHGSLMANEIAAEGANMILTLGSAGAYDVAVGQGADTFAEENVSISQGSLFDVTRTFDETSKTLTYTATAKSADNIAQETGVSTQTATVISALATSENEIANQVALNIQNALANGDTATVEKAASDLAPTTASTVHSVSTTVHTQVLNVVSNRFAPAVVGRAGGDINAQFGPWVQGLYNKSKQDSSSKNEGFRGYTQGVAFGLDAQVNDVYTLGAGYAYSATDVKSNNRKTDVYGHNFFIYGKYQPNNWYVNAIVNYSTSDYKEHKNTIGVGMIGKYNVDTWGGQLMTGYQVSGFEPKAGLRYLHIKQDSYRDEAGQLVKSDNPDLLTAVAGISYGQDLRAKDFVFTPEVRLAATYDLVSDNSDATVFVGTSSYTTVGRRLPRFGVEAGVGVTMAAFDRVDVSLNYDAGIRRDYSSHTGTLKLKYNF